jgi:hypothetical protein
MAADVMDVGVALTDAVSAALATVPAPEPVVEDVPLPGDVTGDAPVTEAPAPDADAPEDDAPETDAPPDAPVTLPDGFVAPKAITDKLATEFVIRDSDGEIEVPDVTIEYKANGKVRKDRLDHVVKLAQWGAYNQEKVAEIERTAATVQQERDEYVQLLEQREAQLERLLSDDEYLASVRDAYERENSPERRAARAEQEVQSVRVQAQMERISQQGQQFYRDEIVPALQMIQEALPTVTGEEMEQRIAYAMALHAEQAPNGQKYLPAAQFNAVRQFLVNDLVFWAQMQHAMRSEGTAPATPAPVTPPPAAATAPAPEVTRAQAEAQKAKQALARATRPMGRGTDGKFASDKPAPRAIKTVDDAMASATADALAPYLHG